MSTMTRVQKEVVMKEMMRMLQGVEAAFSLRSGMFLLTQLGPFVFHHSPNALTDLHAPQGCP